MKARRSLPVFALLSTLALAAQVKAVSITVPNGSFEGPSVVGVNPYYAQFPVDAAGVSGAWERYGPTFHAVYEAGRYGASPAGLNGLQAATVGATTGGGIFQDTAPYDGSGSASLYWQAGLTYTMTTGLFLRGDNPPPAPDALDLKFFYRTADQGAAIELAVATVTVGTNPLSTTSITDYSVSFTVPAGSPAVGKPIGLWLTARTGSSGDWGVDNVRLTAVPEPSPALLAGLLPLGLLVRRRR
jgi:hypothetical protein